MGGVGLDCEKDHYGPCQDILSAGLCCLKGERSVKLRIDEEGVNKVLSDYESSEKKRPVLMVVAS